MNYNIPRDYTETPGARWRHQGPYSGEEFREERLEPLYQKVRGTNEIITITLDGAYGYPPSFLEEAFGGLVRQYPNDDVYSKFSFVSNDQPDLIEKIHQYIIHANDDSGKRG